MSMSVTEVKAWVCDKCGYIWIKVAGRHPLRCPGCRTRSWNSDMRTVTGIKNGTTATEPLEISDSKLVAFDDL